MKLKKEVIKKECSIDDCNGVFIAKGYCYKHYRRFKNHGSPHVNLIKINPCKVDGCEIRRARQGYCSQHYGYFARYGTPIPDVKLKFHSKSLDEAYEYGVIRNKENECWGWKRTTNNGGYGYFSSRGQKKWAAHRYSYEKYIGQIPDGLFVLHRCDNPPCSNPLHLFLGTNSDNTKDAYDKGRRKAVPIECMPRGNNCHLSKLTENQVVEIKKMISNGKSNTEIAKLFGVIHQTISAIRNKKTWKHII